MIIAIDGPAGAGKSTVARSLARTLGFLYVDTGAMYRALTLKIIQAGSDFSDENKIVELAGATRIELSASEAGRQIVRLDGKDVSEAIRRPEVTEAVYHIADLYPVRKMMVEWQREFGREKDIVMEGRDIGTVVFPLAEIKIYLDASVEERARRRFLELKDKGLEGSEEDLRRQIEERDARDRARPWGALRLAEGALRVDTTGLSIEEVVEKLVKLVAEKC